MFFSKDLVWDKITDSAKTRFDYLDFETTFADFQNKNLPENILFQILVGYANGESNDKISNDINQRLLQFGCRLDLDEFLSGKDKILESEIEAVKFAMMFFQMGVEVPFVLDKIGPYLNR